MFLCGCKFLILRGVIAGLYDTSVFSFIRNQKNCLSQWLRRFAFPPAVPVPADPHPCQQFFFLSVLDFGHSYRYVMLIVFICIFPMTYDEKQLSYAYMNLCIFFDEVSVESFGLFFNLVVHFLIVEF